MLEFKSYVKIASVCSASNTFWPFKSNKVIVAGILPLEMSKVNDPDAGLG